MKNDKTININEIKSTCKKIVKLRDLIAQENFSKQAFDKNLSAFKAQLERLLLLINVMPIREQPSALTHKMNTLIQMDSSKMKEDINDITEMAKVFAEQL